MKFMDENASSFSPSYSQPPSPKIYINRPSGSGLTLVIPSLKSLKAQKASQDPQPRSSSLGPVFQDVDNQEKRLPRPVKLKPLKEVLTKLISQIKKKDDYAFFLHPVDVANIPGYADVVKRPMDLGTMTDKVNRGKYRSLEDFASDLKLVTTNAKLFNPPGSIYHTEADRLEVWALDHITRAAATVIQYETDWNIEIEKDDEGAPVNVDDDEEYPAATPMDVDGAGAATGTGTSLRERSMSSQPQPGPSRRGPRGPYKKHASATGISETLEPDGGLPGSKDGLGSFPPGSDWARTMVALKRKGKRYKTKKERLRIEREGPPLLSDGSLDYTEMEDPFSVLSFFVPEPPSRPHLVPLYPPLYIPPADPSSSQNQTPHPTAPPPTFPAATALPLDHVPPDLPFLHSLTTAPPSAPGGGAPKQQQPTRRRHWTLARSATWRNKGKERDDDPAAAAAAAAGLADGGAAEVPAWRMPRPAQATDFGTFAPLAGALAEEMRRRVGGVPLGAAREGWEQEAVAGMVRARLSCVGAVGGVPAADVDMGGVDGVDGVGADVEMEVEEGKGYWTPQRAAEAEEYIRDMVYGGVEGLAYVRSLAEFVDGDYYCKEDIPQDEENDPAPAEKPSVLGMPLAQWVETHIVDPLTEGRHALLCAAARELALQLQLQQTTNHTQNPHHPPDPPTAPADPCDGTVAGQVAASLRHAPYARAALAALLRIRTHRIDMGALIRAPAELFLSEEEWAGKRFKERRRGEVVRRLQAEVGGAGGLDGVGGSNGVGAGVGAAAAASNGAGAGAGVGAGASNGTAPIPAGLDPTALKERLSGRAGAYEQEGPAELSEVLEHVAELIVALDRRTRAQAGDASVMKVEEQAPVGLSATTTTTGPGVGTAAGATAEDPALRNLRLNLLALAKRAPLDTIARLPKDLVPEHIRHFVPTLGPTG